MWDAEPAESVANCVCQIKTKEQTVHVNTDVYIQNIPCKNRCTLPHYCVEMRSPQHICHFTNKHKIPTTVAKPNQYEVPGAHAEDESRVRSSRQDTHRKACCCSGSKFAYLERATLRQTAATMVMALIQIQAGTAFCFSGVTLPQLTDPATHDLFLEPHQAALFGSLVNLGAVAGTCLSWPLLVRLGQRKTLLVGLPISLLAWFTLIFSPLIWLLQMARFILGLTMSLLTPAVNLYLLEISHRKIRGRLLGAMTLSRNFGGLVVNLIGSLSLSWRHVGLVCSTFSVLPIVGVLFLPDSPRWLLTRDRVTEAGSALMFFRKKGYDPRPELHAITDQVEHKTGTGGSIWWQMKMLFQSQTRKNFCVLSLITVFVTFCGCYPLSTYLVPILQTTHNEGDPYLYAVIYSCVRILGIIIHLGVVDKLGRKPLIIVSFLFCSVCTATYATYFHFLDKETIPDISWVPLTLLLLFSFFSGIGLPVIPVLQGELLPTNCRAAGLSLLTCLLMMGGFTSSHTYYMTAATLGQDGAFWLYTSSSALLVLVATFSLPETRGRALEEISTPCLRSKHSLNHLSTTSKTNHLVHRDTLSMAPYSSVWSVSLPGTMKPKDSIGSECPA